MDTPCLKILFVEDLAADAELAQRALRKEGLTFDAKVLDTRDEFAAALGEWKPDIIISDYSMPTFDGRAALKLARAHDADLPFIILTGSLNEETAVACIKAGATDYVLKDRMARLPFAVREALEQRRLLSAKQAMEQALRQAEELYRTILQASPDGIFTTDLQGRIIFASQHMVELCGYSSAEDVIGRLALDFISPMDRARAARVLQNALHGRSLGYHELAMTRKDGTTFVGEILTTVLHDAAGNVASLVSVLRDITERKQTEDALRASEARYRSLFEDAAVAIWEQDLSALRKYLDDMRAVGITDVKTYLDAHPEDAAYCATLFRVIDLNRECLALFQARSKDEMRLYLADYFAGESWDVFKQMVAALAAGQTQFEGEISIHRPRGDIRHILLRLSVAPFYQTTLARVLVSLTDVTEREQRERELQAVSAISGTLRLVSTRAEMLTLIANQVAQLLNAENVAIGSYDPLTNEAVHEVNVGAWKQSLNGARIPAGVGVTGYVRTHKQTYITNDLANDLLYYSRDHIGKMQGLVCMPLLTSQGDLVGWLAAGVARVWTPEDLRILTAIADIAANALHRHRLHEQLEQRVRRLDALHSIDMAISSNFDLSVTMATLLAQTAALLGVDAAEVFKLNGASGEIEYLASFGFRSAISPSVRTDLCEKHGGRVVQSGSILVVNLADPAEICRKRARIAREGFVAYAGAPLIIKGQVKGVLEVFNRQPLKPTPDWLDFFKALATQAAVALDNMTLFENLQRSNVELVQAYDSTLEGWARALDLRDRETEGHSRRVAELSIRLARKMGINGELMTAIWRGALLHDIGKLGIPDVILHKPGELTAEEWQLMRKHPDYAYQMLAPIVHLSSAVAIPYCHHERWDGSGYPRGLKGEQIPLAARVFAIADVWDALIRDRPYRPAWTRAQALEYIQTQSGIEFDPQAVAVFLTVIKETE